MSNRQEWLCAFGERLSAARIESGMSQAELGRRVAADRQTVYRWEAGLIAPDAHRVAALCEALEVTADSLLAD